MKNIKLSRYLWAVLSFTIVFSLWYLFARFGDNKYFPGPIEVIDFILRSITVPIGKDTLLGHILWSLSRVMVGFVLASVIGILLGYLMSWSKIAEAIIRPFYLMLRPIPPIAWVPLAILWFSVGENSKYFIIFIGTVQIIMTNTADGVRRVDKNLIGVARMLGTKENQIFMKIIFPCTVPYIFAGLQVGLGVSWATMVAAEMIASSAGVGWVIVVGQESLNMAQVLGGIIVIGIVGFLLVTIMRGVEAKLCAWNERGK